VIGDALAHHPPDTPQDVEQLRTTLKHLHALSLAALLREVAAVLFNRSVNRWRVLVDISDELIDAEMLAVRERLIERVLDQKPPAALPSRTTLEAERRQARRSRR